MSDFKDPLFTEMFGWGVDINIEVVNPEVPGLDDLVLAIDDRPTHSWAGGAEVRKIIQNDLIFNVLGDLPPKPAKPLAKFMEVSLAKSKLYRHRKKVQEIVSSAGFKFSTDPKEALDRLAISVGRFIETTVRDFA